MSVAGDRPVVKGGHVLLLWFVISHGQLPLHHGWLLADGVKVVLHHELLLLSLHQGHVEILDELLTAISGNAPVYRARDRRIHLHLLTQHRGGTLLDLRGGIVHVRVWRLYWSPIMVDVLGGIGGAPASIPLLEEDMLRVLSTLLLLLLHQGALCVREILLLLLANLHLLLLYYKRGLFLDRLVVLLLLWH